MTPSIPHTLIRSKRRSLAIQIRDNGEVLVRAPLRTPLGYILGFLEEKKVWIQYYQQKMYARIEIGRGSIQKKKLFVSGEEFLYMGELYILTIYDGRDIRVVEETRELLFPRQYLLVADKKIITWYKKMAFEKIEAITRIYSEATGWKYTSLRITSAQTRWGSCSSTRINFTWRLVMAPYQSIEYVVVHELAHIKEKNHGKKFWDSVEKVLPDFRKRKKWLRDNQRVLTHVF